MSTQQVRNQPAAEMETPEERTGATTQPTDPKLSDELREFGKQFEALLRIARTSPRRKEIESQLTAAWRDVEKGINSTLDALKEKSPELKETLSGAAATAVEELQSGLARALHGLNQWLAKTIQEAEEARRKREMEISKAATHGTADDEIADRFEGEPPVFGKGLVVPGPHIDVTAHPAPDESKGPHAGITSETLITERFNDKPIAFGEPKKAV